MAYMRDPFSYRSLNPKIAGPGSTSAALIQYIDRKCVPLEVTMEITLDCNLRCLHCYNFNRTRGPSGKQDGFPLSEKEVLSVIDQVYDQGCLNITFSGGEPLLHPGLYDFSTYARNKHMGIYLKSNGTLFTEKSLRKLVEARIMGIEVSLYGAGPETHDSFTGTPGSFSQSQEGITRVKDAGIHTRITFIMTRSNWGEADNMIRLAEEMELEYGTNTQISRRYDGTSSSLDHQMTRQQLKQLYSGPLRSHLPEPDFDPECSVQCGCARGVCGISAYGDVYPCIGAPLSAGNIRETPFADIWKNSDSLNKIRSLKLEDFKVCKSCPHRPYCRRSSGFVYVNTGNYTGTEEWTCMEAEVIHEVFEGRLRIED
ncbi:radical SAM/SPASM domain-containing protein [Fibrobacterota bacterium]